MTLSTQKLIIVLLLINLSLSLVDEVYYQGNPNNLDTDNFQTESLDEFIGTADGLAQEFEDEETNPPSKLENFVDQSFGGLWKWGARIKNIFNMIFNPFDVNVDPNAEIGVRMLAKVLQVLRGLFNILVILEIYMFIKNKKVS